MMLAEVIDAYVTLQQSLGMRFDAARKLLRQFSREMGNPDIDKVQTAAVAGFLRGTGALSATWALKYRVLSGFYKFAISRGHADGSPLPTNCQSCRHNSRPMSTPPTSCGDCSMPHRLHLWETTACLRRRTECCCYCYMEADCASAKHSN